MAERPQEPSSDVAADPKFALSPHAGSSDTESSLLVARDQVQNTLRHLWKEVLDVDPVDVRQDFFEMGGDSVQASRLCARLEETFGIQLNPAMMFEARSIESQMAVLLAGRRPRHELSSLVCVHAAGARPPIFFLHTHGGTAAYCARFTRYLGADQRIYGVHSQALSGRPPHFSIEEMAKHYIQELRYVQPAGPYYLFGYCAGGLVAFEIAQQLSQQNETVAFLGMFNTPVPGSFSTGFLGRLAALKRRTRYELHLMREPGATHSKFVQISERIGLLLRRVLQEARDSAWRVSSELLRKEIVEKHRARAQEIEYINTAASKNYRPANPFAGRITFFSTPSLDYLYTIDPITGWEPLSQGIDIVELSENDSGSGEDSQTKAVAEVLRLHVDADIKRGLHRNAEHPKTTPSPKTKSAVAPGG